MIIRDVTPQDAAAIAAINNPYILHTTISFETEPLSTEAMRQRIESIASECPYIVAENQGEIIGFAYAHPWKERKAYHRTLETTIYLAPAHQRKGLGTRLMQQLIERCRCVGAHALIACITADNTASIELHTRLGFRKVSHFTEVGCKFGQLLDVVDMELML